jgi:hypothetical protein
MLLVVRGIRDIKFWDIVPMEHLLARLEAESHGALHSRKQ